MSTPQKEGIVGLESQGKGVRWEGVVVVVGGRERVRECGLRVKEWDGGWGGGGRGATPGW